MMTGVPVWRYTAISTTMLVLQLCCWLACIKN